MNWIKINREFIYISLITLLLLVVLEATSAIVFYQKLKLPGWSVSSAVHLAISSKSLNNRYQFELIATDEDRDTGSKDKLHAILSSREAGNTSYPSYLFEPQYHHPNMPYFLANVPHSQIIYCDENGFFNKWMSDELGFRNPGGQIHTTVDYVFVGDSFAEGACEDEEGTIAGHFRENNFVVANLARGGSGPLFQLATLVEYGDLFESKYLVWLVFTGNDLQNLAEEKVTLLRQYLDPRFSQNLYQNQASLAPRLISFLDAQLLENKARHDSGLPYPTNKGYGEALDAFSAQKYEAQLLKEVAQRMHNVALAQNKELRIVILNHYKYDEKFKAVTSQAIRDFADRNSLLYLEFSSNFLEVHMDFYTQAGIHFNSHGYRSIAEVILSWLESYPVASIVK